MTFELPQILYKYRALEPLERIRQIFKGELYFSSPKDFNDPMDSIIPLDLNLTRKEWKFFFERNMDRMPGQNRAERRKNKAIASASETVRQLNAQDLASQAVAKKYSVYSLSANELDWRMWSYYADGGRGIVIGFNTNMFDSDPLFRVNYADEVPKIKASDSDDARLVTYLTKSMDYSHEKEYRIIRLEDPGVKVFPKNNISRLILGCKICKKHLEDLKKIVRELNISPAVFKIVLPKSGMSFKLALKKYEF